MLRNLGADIELATNGLEAVKMAQNGDYDLILMDVQMPIKDGLEATTEIREKFSADMLPIIAITAHALKSEIDRCFEMGMNGYITKPFSKEKLVAGISEHLKDIENIDTSDIVTTEETDVKKYPATLPGLEIRYSIKSHDINFDTYLEIVNRFLSTTEKLVKELKKYFFAYDWKKVAELSHNIKGSSSNVGAFDLQKSATLLEDRAGVAFRSKNEVRIKLLDAVESKFNIVKSSIEELNATNGPKKVAQINKQFDMNEIKPLIKSLFASLDEYDPIASAEITDKLKLYIDEKLLEELRYEIDEYEFDNAKKRLIELESKISG